MIRLMLILLMAFLLLCFIRELKKYFARDDKAEEFKSTILQGVVVDIDREIALEKARQKHIESDIKDINSIK